MRRRIADAIEAQDLGKIDREIDWAIKHKLVQRYLTKHNMDLSSPRIALIDLAYHDIEIEDAKDTPPQTTRAKLRGDFIAAAQAAGRDFTVDWVHLTLNDQAQRTVLCKDPFRAYDERVDRLIASM